MLWLWKYLSIDIIFCIIGLFVILYVVFFGDRKTYPFQFEDTGFFKVSKKKIKRKKSEKKHEKRCREIFESIYRAPFKSVRPDWLKNPATGKNLEIDGFCPYIRTPYGIGIGFEYDGEQHAKYNPHYHGGDVRNFEYQCKKDAFKDKVCKSRGVLLIRIPHFVAYQDLERYIKNELQKKRVLPSHLQGNYGTLGFPNT